MAIHAAAPGSVAARAFLNVAVGTPLNDIFELHGKDLVHVASFTPNIGPFMEFKGNADLPVECPTSSIKSEKGVVRCPTGPGFGVKIDPDFDSLRANPRFQKLVAAGA